MEPVVGEVGRKDKWPCHEIIPFLKGRYLTFFLALFLKLKTRVQPVCKDSRGWSLTLISSRSGSNEAEGPVTLAL